VEPAVDEKLSILLRHNHVILLTQISDDVLNPRYVGRGLIGMCGGPAELFAALSNLASATHPDALYLFQRYAELGRKLCVVSAFRKPLQQLISPF
jgi:hypothetical protein